MVTRKARPPMVVADAHEKEMASLLRANAHRHRLGAVFSDFCEMAAISISNAVDLRQFKDREERYLQIVSKYERPEVERFAHLLGVLVEWLGFGDRLGQLFMSLELSDDFKGQYFSPYPLSSLMARISMGDARETIARQGFITVNEPACGAGGMVVACADALRSEGIHYQQAMHVIAQDIDATAVHMTFLQLSLYHLPAIIVHGNTIAMTQWARWLPPAHVLGGWDRRLQQQSALQAGADLFEVPTAPADAARSSAPGDAAGQAKAKAEDSDSVEAQRAAAVTERLGQLSPFS